MTNMINDTTELKFAKTNSQTSSSEHLVPLHGDFALWRWACLRGAGFPAHIISQLAAPATASQADQLLTFRADLQQKHVDATAAMRYDLQACHDPEQRKEMFRAINQFKKFKLTKPLALPCEAARQSFWELYTSEPAKEEQFREAFKADIATLSLAFRKVLANPEFQQAMIVQNREALRRTMDSLLNAESEPTKRTTKEKRKEELIAKYLQRYCVKNDSIGFFGPVGWVKFNPHRQSTAAQAGPNLVKSSTFYFEQWCIETLAERLGEDASLREWMAPRRLPTFYLNDSKLSFPGGTSTALRPLQAAVLKKCTGEKTARQIAMEVLEGSAVAAHSTSDIYQILEEFSKRGIITWTFELPWFYPERSLRRLLERIDVEEKRRTALGMLNELEEAKDRVNAAFGDPVQLDSELQKLEQTFNRLTGKDSTRHAGKMYAGRTLTYQDCMRDFDMEVGAELIDQITTPLMPLLSAARWFTFQVAALIREQCRAVYGEALKRSPYPYVELIPIWLRIQPLLQPNAPLFCRVAEALQARWEWILRVPQDCREVSYNTRDLKSTIEHAFPAPRPGWETARHHSPDVMVAAASVEAIRNGEYLLVLGELHMGINTLRSHFTMSQHPFPDQMFQAFEADMPAGQIFFSPSRSLLGATARTTYSLVSSYDYHLEGSQDSLSTAPRSRTLAISEFVVADSPDGLVVQTRDGRLKYDIVEFLGDILSYAVADCMKILSPRSHVPRVTFDRMVIQREQWAFAAAEVPFAEEENLRFLEIRRWMRQHQLPRYVFVRSHLEEKPFYLDFDSPVYVEILSKLARRILASDKPDSPITVSEMLPNIEQLWLPDAADQRYSSEFRLVIVDRAEQTTKRVSKSPLPMYERSAFSRFRNNQEKQTQAS